METFQFQRSTNEAVADVKCKKNLLELHSMRDRPVNTGACFPFCPASGRANTFFNSIENVVFGRLNNNKWGLI